MTPRDEPTRLLVEWERLQGRGLIGPGPVDALLRHSEGFRAVAEEGLGGPPGLAADLGTGVGIPGLALALSWPESEWWLVEANQRRAGVAGELVRILGLTKRVRVRAERAEDLGRGPAARASIDLVVSRLFGSPAVAAECAAPLLRVGGGLVVSEPPDEQEGRWPPEGVGALGLSLQGVRSAGRARFALLTQVEAAPDRFPRRAGVPAKRPLW